MAHAAEMKRTNVAVETVTQIAQQAVATKKNALHARRD
jgi:hypothetical protein